jgi:hypothetical protein
MNNTWESHHKDIQEALYNKFMEEENKFLDRMTEDAKVALILRGR